MRIGICATVGGLKPVALVGLLRALEDQDLLKNVVAYSGASGGAIWCALAAKGYTPQQLWDLALTINSKAMWEDWQMAHLLTAVERTVVNHKVLAGFTGLLEGDRALTWLRQELGAGVTFEQLKLPFYCVAFNINRGRTQVFGPNMTLKEVEVAQAVRGSISIPFCFRHQTIQIADGPEGTCGFWDGGVTSSLPLRPLVAFHDIDLVLALDATGATDEPGQKWTSIDQLGVIDLAERMVHGLVDESNATVLQVAEEVCPTEVMQISVGASMADPARTIKPALEASYADAKVFVKKVFG